MYYKLKFQLALSKVMYAAVKSVNKTADFILRYALGITSLLTAMAAAVICVYNILSITVLSSAYQPMSFDGILYALVFNIATGFTMAVIYGTTEKPTNNRLRAMWDAEERWKKFVDAHKAQ